jgi:hypothetical protein
MACRNGAGKGGPYFWQAGQWKVERPDCTARRIVPVQPGVGQAAPSRS